MKTSDAAVRSDNPSARRGQSKPRYMAERAADSFDGPLSRGSTSRNAWTKSGGRRGWADALPAHFRMFLKFTRDEDWTRGNRPIIYLTVKAAAKRLEVLQVRRNERRLSGWRNCSSSLAGWRRSARARSPPAPVTAKPVVAMLNAVPSRDRLEAETVAGVPLPLPPTPSNPLGRLRPPHLLRMLQMRARGGETLRLFTEFLRPSAQILLVARKPLR